MPYPAQIVDRKWLPKESGAFRYLEAVSPNWRPDGDEPDVDDAGNDGPRYSRDSMLNALAQLGASRLSVKRAMISIVTRSMQHVIAEATRTISLRSQDMHDPDDGIWMGCCALPTSTGLCQWTVSQASRVREELGSHGDVHALRCFVVNDLSQDDRFKDAPFVTGAPFARFYAGAPIISKSTGKTIGSYCVFDDSPIDHFGPDSVQLMVDMADATADHLELVRTRLDRSRSENMIRGIGSFIEGKASIHEWWSSTRTELARPEREDSHKREIAVAPGIKAKEDSRATRSSNNLEDEVLASANYSSAHDEQKPSISSSSAKSSSTSDITGLFRRASNIVREAVELQGVFFLDATSAVRRSDDTTSTDRELNSSTGEEISPSREDQTVNFCNVLGYSTVDNPSGTLADADLNDHPVDERLLKSFLRRYPTGKVFNLDDFSSNDSETTSAVSEDPEDIATRSGKAKSDESETERWKRKLRLRSRVPRRSDVSNLARIFPGARSVAFYPLWDWQKGRWYAGVIAYTNHVLRTLRSESELGYLAAFGSSVMTEVSRMVAIRDDRAKADFISSISHELRSPLHGILGNTEFLKGTPLDGFQADMVYSIDTCGRTLLDTVNHLLDFTKINNFLRSSGKGGMAMTRRRSGFDKAEAKVNPKDWMMSLESDLDLAILTEEVMQTAFAGHGFRMHSSSTHSDIITSPGYNQTSATDKQLTANKPLSLVLDIRPSNSYIFRAQAGALRRILMNTCGNALKYTTSGFVRVELQRRSLSPIHGAEMSEVTLTISDSGKGISQAYLRDRLFTPFAQEDPYTPGTGLGLSIAKQITKSLHGSIDVQSKVAVGTIVEITFKLKHSKIDRDVVQQHVVQPIQDYDGISEVASQTRGWRLAIYMFATPFSDPGILQRASKIEQKESKASALLQDSLKRMCESWFGMQVLGPSESNGNKPDVYLTDLMSAYKLRPQPETFGQSAPVIVVCPDSEFAAQATNTAEQSQDAGNFVLVAQPLGPLKFARVLSTLLQRGMTKQNQEPFPQVVAEYKPPDPKPQNFTNVTPVTKPQLISTDSMPRQETLGSLEAVADNETTSKPATPGLQLLLVEDNNINLQLLVAFCKQQKAAYTTATNGMEALEAYKAAGGAFDFVLMDISMPVMDGLESTREIRGYERKMGLNPTSIVALTGLASEAAQKEAFGSGVDVFLTKPVRLQELRDLLRTSVLGEEEIRAQVKS